MNEFAYRSTDNPNVVTKLSTGCAMMHRMNSSPSLHDLGAFAGNAFGRRPGAHILRNIGLATAGVTVLAVGVVVGRELRQRYKFNRRTPYDFYSHSNDQMQDVEFGVGI